MTDRKPLNELTPNEIQQEIAERLPEWSDLQWKEIFIPDGKGGTAVQYHLQGRYHKGITISEPKRIPDWPGDLNEAATLLKLTPYAIEWVSDYCEWYVVEYREDATHIYAIHDNPATAICYAWLTMEREKETDYE
jgi:hypothetical protein